MSDSSITEGALLAAATSTLRDNGYLEVPSSLAPEIDPTRQRLFEDVYSLVLVAAFPNASDLVQEWSMAQSRLSKVMTRTLHDNDAKSWEGYLVLIAASMPDDLEQQAMTQIAYDTRRARKIVITPVMFGLGLDLLEPLLPLLPIPAAHVLLDDPLAVTMRELSKVLDQRDGASVTVLFEASEANTSLMEALEGFVESSDTEQGK